MTSRVSVYDEIEDRFGDDSAPGVREQVSAALVNKGLTLDELDRSEAELAIYEQVVDRFGDDSTPGVREQVACALFTRASPWVG